MDNKMSIPIIGTVLVQAIAFGWYVISVFFTVQQNADAIKDIQSEIVKIKHDCTTDK